ncbi:MAG: outer membrane homotrimeric porin [Pseudomonadota bacterium]
MKRIVTLLLAAGLVMGAYTGAQAADVKVSGKWNFGFDFSSNADYSDGEDDFVATQRLRLQLDIIASENLKGVIFFEIGNSTWGDSSHGAALGADGKTVEVKRSYIDWTIPNSDAKVRMGIQGVTLPGGAFGSALLDDDVAALVVSNAFSDNFALTAFWARPFDGGYSNSGVGTNFQSESYNDEMDMFGLIAPITLDGHAITPYFVYASVGEDVLYDGYTSEINNNGNIRFALTEDLDIYYFGVAYSMTAFDPFTLDVSFLYGNADNDDIDQSGWMVDFKAAYALDFMTPAIIGWYASGADSKGDGVLPTFAAGAWYPTSFGYVGSCYRMDTNTSESPEGTWAIGLELADISFIEDLTHVFRFVYSEATNDSDAADYTFSSYGDAGAPVMMRGDDSSIEINFDSTYQIYENLAFIVELGMIDYNIEGTSEYDETAYKATFNFVYSF